MFGRYGDETYIKAERRRGLWIGVSLTVGTVAAILLVAL
jgi:hypothetical protein